MTTQAAGAVEDQDFDKAFDQAAADAEKGVQTPATEPVKEVVTDDAAAKKAADDAAAAKAAEEAAAKKAAEETPEAKAAAEAAAKKAAEDAAAAKAAAETPEAKAAKEAADKKAAEEAAAAEAAAKKAAEETPEQKKVREEFEASIKPYEPTDDEKKALEAVKKDFPEIAAVVEARLKSVDRDVNRRVYEAVKNIIDHVGGRVQSVEQLANELGQQAHFDALYKAHPDYDEVVAKIPDWIKTQPAIVQPALQAAYKQGDTQQVLELVATYKAAQPKATGKTPEQIEAEQKKVDEAAAKKKQADEEAAALAPVTSKRSTASPKGGPDKDDFDGAFAEASAALDK